MPRLTPADEFFYHQIPEPLPNVVTFHEHWRESLFFITHHPETPKDVLCLTLAHFPKREEMDSLQLNRIDGQPVFMRHARDYDGDPHTMAVGPVRIDITEPLKTIRLFVDPKESPLGLDLTFSARTAAHALRRGTMKAGHETIWDQSHMIQSGWFDGSYTVNGETRQVDHWWGQRDHSWGIRDHRRCPMWMWLAIQLPDGMISVWNWEYANGARVYTDGCFAPADGSDPIPVIRFEHELQWLAADGQPVSYDRDGETVMGLGGHVDIMLEGGKRIGIDAEGRWAARYGAVGGGLSEMHVRTDDGRQGTAIYEITGAHHWRYFPVARAENLPG
ncbi:MAG: hypothetical protein LC118_12875 [Dehalococcoidia bacterium]|nr:hypothetical protein [Dehalococcoidia bacterium]